MDAYTRLSDSKNALQDNHVFRQSQMDVYPIVAIGISKYERPKKCREVPL